MAQRKIKRILETMHFSDTWQSGICLVMGVFLGVRALGRMVGFADYDTLDFMGFMPFTIHAIFSPGKRPRHSMHFYRKSVRFRALNFSVTSSNRH